MSEQHCKTESRKMGFKLSSPSAPKGMVILQVLRACTVVTLAAMCASYIVFIIKVDKERSYFVFECASLFFNSIITIVLILSEFPMVGAVRDYFRTSWPVLSDRRGVGWLGFAMILLACNIFGNLNHPANDTDKLGPHFSKLVLGTAILATTFGSLNMICALIWRSGEDGVHSRDIRTNGALATGHGRQSLPDYSSTAGSTMRNEKTRSKFASMFWKKDSGGNSEKPRPNISGPIDVEHGNGNDDRRSPIVPDLRRPDTALHPMHARSSSYSEANMSRF